MADPIPEQVYLDAAGAYIKALRAYDRSLYGSDEAWERDVRGVAAPVAMRADLRAAVESAYRAARLATAREIAAARCPSGSLFGAAYRAAMNITDELERAARAAGKDKT